VDRGVRLLAYATHAVRTGSARAAAVIDDADRLASAHGLRELQAEAALLRVAIGSPGALASAREHVAAVDNPVLANRLAALEATGAGRASGLAVADR
jgi:hypothetical protein